MIRRLEAIYENGVLRPLGPLGPLGPLDLAEHQRVTFTVTEAPAAPGEEDWLDVEYIRDAAAEADAGVSLEAIRAKTPGSLTANIIAERADR